MHTNSKIQQKYILRCKKTGQYLRISDGKYWSPHLVEDPTQASSFGQRNPLTDEKYADFVREFDSGCSEQRSPLRIKQFEAVKIRVTITTKVDLCT